MTNEQLDENVRIAEAATKQPWAAHGPYSEGGFLDNGYLIETGYPAHEPEPEVGDYTGREPLHGGKSGFTKEDAEFIAAATHKDTGLAAVSRECVRLRGLLKEACDMAMQCASQIDDRTLFAHCRDSIERIRAESPAGRKGKK